MKTVLLFQTPATIVSQLGYDALFRIAKSFGWRVQTIPHLNKAVLRQYMDVPFSACDPDELFAMWRPAGCIVECGGFADAKWMDKFTRLPTVFIDCPVVERHRRHVCVRSDASAIALAAAKELLSLGLDSFAYMDSWDREAEWSRERHRLFARILAAHGKRLQAFKMSKPDAYGMAKKGAADFLASLPKPCGVFVCNDFLAQSVEQACFECGLRIPGDVAIVSVDNSEDVCERLPVSLTSIEQDFAAAGEKAARALEMLMRGTRPPEKFRLLGVRRIVRRASTSRIGGGDGRVAAAVEFIRVNACSGISPADVARAMGCSQRHANTLFKRAVSRTILNEIHARRLSRAKELLSGTSLQLQEIASECGYSSPADFSRVFRRYERTAPRLWRTP